MIAPHFQSIQHDRVRFLLNEVGFIIYSSYNGTTQENIYVEGEKDAGASKVVRVGFFTLEPSTDIGITACAVRVCPEAYISGNVGNVTAHQAWSYKVKEVFTGRESSFDLEDRLNDMWRDVESFGATVNYPVKLQSEDQASIYKERLAKNRKLLPFMLAGDSPEIVSTLLAHNLMANSAIAACVRAGVIQLNQVEEHLSYPQEWLEALLPEKLSKIRPSTDFFGNII